MPGQPADYIERAETLADRVSVNVEAAMPALRSCRRRRGRLGVLAPH